MSISFMMRRRGVSRIMLASSTMKLLWYNTSKKREAFPSYVVQTQENIVVPPTTRHDGVSAWKRVGLLLVRCQSGRTLRHGARQSPGTQLLHNVQPLFRLPFFLNLFLLSFLLVRLVGILFFFWASFFSFLFWRSFFFFHCSTKFHC